MRGRSASNLERPRCAEQTCQMLIQHKRANPLHVICKICNAYYHTRCVKLSLGGSTNFLCGQCNPEDDPMTRTRSVRGTRGASRPQRPRLVTAPVLDDAQHLAPEPALDEGPASAPHDSVHASSTVLNWTASSGPRGQRLDSAPDDPSASSEILLTSATASDWTASVSLSDPSAIMYADTDLELLMMEAREQEQLVTTEKPHYHESWPQFDSRMEALGMVRDPSQRNTTPDGDCVLHAISAQVNT